MTTDFPTQGQGFVGPISTEVGPDNLLSEMQAIGLRGAEFASDRMSCKMKDRLRNLVAGAGSVLSLWPTQRQWTLSSEERKSILEALRSDWKKLGADFEVAQAKMRQENPQLLRLGKYDATKKRSAGFSEEESAEVLRRGDTLYVIVKNDGFGRIRVFRPKRNTLHALRGAGQGVRSTDHAAHRTWTSKGSFLGLDR